MKAILSAATALMLLVSGFAAAESVDLTAAPQAIVEQLAQGEYQQVFDQSSPDLQTALGGTADGLAAVWTQLEHLYGSFQNITNTTAQEQDGDIIAQIICSFAYADVTFIVALATDGLMIGLSVSNVRQKAIESTADQTLFVSEPVTLRPGEEDETQGLLTLPNGDGPFPTVIMMQGSGASDMNETLFGTAVFRDLAEGLAQAGVASIRYDKYTYAHSDLILANPELQAKLTVREEYILDAKDALALLQADGRIGDIYLMGHSQGGMLVPRIMQTLGAENIAGGIILNGTPLAFWEVQLYQLLAYYADAPENERAEAEAYAAAETEKAGQLMSMTDEELLNTTLFETSAYYAQDEMSVDAAQTAIALGKPLLIVQGGKDWQVPPAKGIEAWQTALDGQLAADYLLYPNMNHMLFNMEGEPVGDTSDYQAGSVASQALIADIAAWILAE